MTAARGIAIYFAASAVVLVLLLALIFFAFPAHAQSRPADQVRLLSAVHIASPWSTWTSDVWLANESDDPVSVSVTYGAANGPPNPITKRDVIKLAPRQHCEFVDFLGGATSNDPRCKVIDAPLTTSAFGQVVFSACLDGADCSWSHANSAGRYDPPPSVTQNYRDISVASRIYSYASAAGATSPTVGQNFDAVPWWGYGDFEHPLTITGIRNLQDVWHTNIGLVNNSDSQPVTLIVTLFDGASHAQRDQAKVDLPPFGALQIGATALFPLFGEWSRLNRTRAATNAYITVAAAGPDDGFFAYGSLIDSRSGDATTLPATFGRALNDGQIAVLFGAPFNTTPQSVPSSAVSQSLRAAAKSTVATTLTLCRVIPLGSYEYRVEKLDARGVVPLMHFGPPRPASDPLGEMTREQILYDEAKARALCGAVHSERGGMVGR